MVRRLAHPRPPPLRLAIGRAVALVLTVTLLFGGTGGTAGQPSHGSLLTTRPDAWGASSAVGNFSAAIDRLVELLGLAGSGLLSIVWARVALSWFSNDITKKVQAKDRARDALIGTLLFTAAITGLFWGLAHWVLTGS
ncbi:MAG: hypothetical protein WB789_07940 [Thermoplasmata archaeon]